MFHIGNPQMILKQSCGKKRDLTESNYDVLIWADTKQYNNVDISQSQPDSKQSCLLLPITPFQLETVSSYGAHAECGLCKTITWNSFPLCKLFWCRRKKSSAEKF